MTPQANSLYIPLPDGCVHTTITSPPFFRQRLYEGVPATLWPTVTYTPLSGLPPLTIPGYDPECEHDWQTFTRKGTSGGTKSKKVQIKGQPNFQIVPDVKQAMCTKCGGWLDTLGNEPTPEMYTAHLVAIFREVWRVSHPTATLWLNLGDTAAANRSYQVVDGKHKNVGNHLASRVPQGLKPKDIIGIPFRVAFALQADGWYLRKEIIWAKSVSFCDTYNGTCMPESVKDRPTTAHEYLFLFSKSPHYYYDIDAVREPVCEATIARYARGWEGNGERGYVKGPQNHMHDWMDNDEAKQEAIRKGRNLRSVWAIIPKGSKLLHYATFPEKLVEPGIKAGSSLKGCCPNCRNPYQRITRRVNKSNWEERVAGGAIGGTDTTGHRTAHGAGLSHNLPVVESETTGWEPTCNCNAGKAIPALVLDPFCGSGTTGLVAQRLGRRFVGLDASYHYLVSYAKGRTKDKGYQVPIMELINL